MPCRDQHLGEMRKDEIYGKCFTVVHETSAKRAMVRDLDNMNEKVPFAYGLLGKPSLNIVTEGIGHRSAIRMTRNYRLVEDGNIGRVISAFQAHFIKGTLRVKHGYSVFVS